MTEARGASPSSQDDALEFLVCECLERIEARGLAAIEDLCREHPDEAEALRAQIGKLRLMGLLPDAAGSETEPFPGRLDR